MALDVAVGTFAKSTAAATASQPVTGLGFTPKVLILFTPGAPTALATVTAGERWSMGFATRRGGTTQQYAISNPSQDAAAASNASRYRAAKALTIGEWAEVKLAECDLTSFDAGGFTLSWTTNNAVAYQIGYIALGGTDIADATVLNWNHPTVTGNLAVTGAGFQPDVGFTLLSGGAGSTLPLAAAHLLGGIGAMRSTTEQWTQSWCSEDAQATMDTYRFQVTDACMSLVNETGTILNRANFVSWDANGFTLNHTTVTTSPRNVGTLLIKGGSHKVGNFTKATGAAPASQSVAAGFAPGGIVLSSAQQIVSTTVNAHNRFGFGVASGTAETAMAISDTDALADSDVASVISATKAFVKSDNQALTTDAEADATLTATGFDLSWSTNDAVATQLLYWAIGPNAGTGATATPATIAQPATLPAPTVRIDAVATPAAIAVVAALPAPSLSVGHTTSPATVSTVAALPAATATTATNATATPAAIPVATTIPAPTPSASSTPAPAAAVTTATLPASTRSAGSSPTPVTIAGVAALPAPAVLVSTARAPSVVAATAALPPASTTSSATSTPATVAALTTLPAPAVQQGSTTTPAVVAALAALPAPTVTTSGNATPTPAVVAATVALPSPTVRQGASSSPGAIVTTVALPSPTVRQDSGASPAVISAAVAVPTPTVQGSGNATPTAGVVSATATVPPPTVSAGSRPTPTAVAATAALPAPTVQTGSNGTATPATVATSAAVPAPAVISSTTISPGAAAVLVTVPSATVSAGTMVMAPVALVLVAVPTPSVSVVPAAIWRHFGAAPWSAEARPSPVPVLEPSNGGTRFEAATWGVTNG